MPAHWRSIAVHEVAFRDRRGDSVHHLAVITRYLFRTSYLTKWVEAKAAKAAAKQISSGTIWGTGTVRASTRIRAAKTGTRVKVETGTKIKVKTGTRGHQEAARNKAPS